MIKIKTFHKLRIEGNFLNLIKNIYKIPTANIIIHGEKLEAFPPKSEIRQGFPLIPPLFNTVLEVLFNKTKKGDKSNTG